MSQRDYYQVLGVANDAASTEIRAAFIRLAKRHHPDSAGSLPWRLQEVRQAYQCLSDPEDRMAHDRALRASEREHIARQAALRRRLHRYDRRHPHPQPRVPRGLQWRSWLFIMAGAVIVAKLSLRIVG